MAVAEDQGRQPNEPTSMYVPSNYVTLFAKSCPTIPLLLSFSSFRVKPDKNNRYLVCLNAIHMYVSFLKTIHSFLISAREQNNLQFSSARVVGNIPS